jgi:glycerol-3-phosphate cytidylyltransferase
MKKNRITTEILYTLECRIEARSGELEKITEIIPSPTGKEGTVGYAFVVADLLHYGHINFLRQCKKYCDFLIVGIYTDELAKTYKRMPIIPFWMRKECLKELRCVDLVVNVYKGERDQSYPMQRLVKIGWNIKYLFHGDDWNLKDRDLLSAKSYIESIGGELIQPPYTPGISTTWIIKKLKGELK